MRSTLPAKMVFLSRVWMVKWVTDLQQIMYESARTRDGPGATHTGHRQQVSYSELVSSAPVSYPSNNITVLLELQSKRPPQIKLNLKFI